MLNVQEEEKAVNILNTLDKSKDPELFSALDYLVEAVQGYAYCMVERGKIENLTPFLISPKDSVKENVLKIYSILSLAPNSEKFAMIEPNPIKLILHNLSTNNKTEEHISLKILANFSLNSFCCKAMVSANAFDIILSKFAAYPYLSSLILQNLSTDRDFASEICDSGLLSQIIESMDSSKEKTKMAITGLMSNLAAFDFGRKIIMEIGALPIIIKQLELNNNVDLQSNIAKVIQNLCLEVSIRDLIAQNKENIESIVQLLNCEKSLIHAINALTLLADNSKRRLQIAILGLAMLMSLIISTINVKVERTTLSCLSALAQEKEIAKIMSQRGLPPALIGILEFTSDKLVQIQSTRTLYAITRFEGNEAIDGIVAIPALIKAAQKNELQLQRNCIAILSCICNTSSDGQTLIQNGGIQLLVKALNSSISIVNYSLKTLMKLAEFGKVVKVMVESNVFEYSITLLKERDISIEIKNQVCLLLNKISLCEEAAFELFVGHKWQTIIPYLLLYHKNMGEDTLLIDTVKNIVKSVGKRELARNFDIALLLFELKNDVDPIISHKATEILKDLDILQELDKRFGVSDDKAPEMITDDYLSQLFTNIPQGNERLLQDFLQKSDFQRVNEDFFVTEISSRKDIPDTPLLTPGDFSKTLRIEEGEDVPFSEDKFEPVHDIYKEDFLFSRHYNYIVNQDGEISIYSVKDVKNSGEEYKLLKTTKKGTTLEVLPYLSLDVGRRKETMEKLETYLRETIKDCTIYSVTHRPFIKDLMALEEKHPQNVTAMKMAIIYCKGGQISAKEWFANRTPSEHFWDFVNIMGHRINIQNHKGYKGDVGKGVAFYDKWNDIEVIYHLAPILNSEGNRRLIGNDIAVICFQEVGSELNPIVLDDLGTVPQIFCVVQPYKNKYRLAFLSKINIKPFGLPLPYGRTYSAHEVKDKILAKIHAGFIMTKHCPPMNRLYFVPRESALKELAAKYPYENKRERKLRERNEMRQRAIERQKLEEKGLKELLIITIDSCRGLSIKNGFLFMSINLDGEKLKTKTVKATLPNNQTYTWTSSFSFSLIGVENHAELECVVFNYKMGGKEFVGELFLTLQNVRELANIPLETQKQNWLPLQSPISTKGEILLTAEITKEVKGPEEKKVEVKVDLEVEFEKKKKGPKAKKNKKKKKEH